MVLDCHFIQFAIVLDWAQCAVFLFNEEEGGSKRRLGWADTPGF